VQTDEPRQSSERALANSTSRSRGPAPRSTIGRRARSGRSATRIGRFSARTSEKFSAGWAPDQRKRPDHPWHAPQSLQTVPGPVPSCRRPRTRRMIPAALGRSIEQRFVRSRAEAPGRCLSLQPANPASSAGVRGEYAPRRLHQGGLECRQTASAVRKGARQNLRSRRMSARCGPGCKSS
jgi:hypothetical protein